MTSGGRFGPDEPTQATPAPFAVTGPTSVSLDAARTAIASFTVSNVTGRPIRARLIPQPLRGADPAWFSLIGDTERPVGVAGTLTADVRIQIPAAVVAGEHGMRLDVAVEDRPDIVSIGQGVTFSVPPPVKKRFPWWIVIVAGIAVLVLAIGALVVWLTTRGDPAPTNLTAPRVWGSAVAGQTLTVTTGTWQGGEPVEYRWETCDAKGVCEDTGAAPQRSYTIKDTDVDRQLRAVEIASAGPRDAETGEIPGPTAELESAQTATVQRRPAPTTTVPSVVGLTVGKAIEELEANNLQALVGSTGTIVDSCDPPVVSQNPLAQDEAPVGSQVAIAVPRKRPTLLCATLVAPLIDTDLDATDGP